ncbi:MAG TPA: efflux RND transporter periplasmic adaptor subunit [Burkholderiales bacterium]|nr:efflux RND transporter periplasmic adaptor subunit [Burkholderiales bacterium]
MRLRVLLPLLLALGACSQAGEDRPDEIRPVRVVKVGISEGARHIEYAGEVRARHETRLAFRVSGKVIERLVEVGSTVRPGQVIARMDDTDFKLAAASARANVASLKLQRDLADADFRRFRELREKNFISQAEYDRRASELATAEARLAAARAQAEQAVNAVRYATLYADVAGVVTAVEVEAGQVIAPGHVVVRVARPGEKEIAFAVPEAQRRIVEKSSALEVSLNAVPGATWKATLRELSPAADPVTRMYAARATILDAGEAIELGMSATVELAAASETRIEVPIAALHSRGADAQVFVVEPKGTVRVQKVKTAGVTGERVVIESGLAPGDVVVAAGAQLLRPGQRVRILDEK